MKNKMRYISLLLAMLLIVMMPVSVQAETYYGSDSWGVTFTADSNLDTNFDTGSFNDVISGMQPGDNVIITLTLRHENSDAANWYMTNRVLNSLEDSSQASGGAYTYILTYHGKSGDTVLYSSDTVGGEGESAGGEGLHEATNALGDYFFLEALTKGDSTSITLEIALDGETQGNGYQDTLADLSMNFAVEPLDSPTPSETPREPGVPQQPTLQLVKTGDESIPVILLILMAIVGVVLMGLSIYSMRLNRRNRRG